MNSVPNAPQLSSLPIPSVKKPPSKPPSAASIPEELANKVKRSEDKDHSSAIEATSTGTNRARDTEVVTRECRVCGKHIVEEVFEAHLLAHPTMVVEGLFVGGQRNAANFEELTKRVGVHCILNCAVETPNYFPENFTYLCLPCVVLRT